MQPLSPPVPAEVLLAVLVDALLEPLLDALAPPLLVVEPFVVPGIDPLSPEVQPKPKAKARAVTEPSVEARRRRIIEGSAQDTTQQATCPWIAPYELTTIHVDPSRMSFRAARSYLHVALFLPRDADHDPSHDFGFRIRIALNARDGLRRR